ncbi:hypothetical protein HCU64_21590 [Methylobacterium sp. C25]|uniref:hypothetical protein n=1 Tax=Methylobacterium sp. C25 TaxID=2721622 RepID=UPI001F18C340|nr:hypothetical protein [Methylobacterium sp. C25]MCE4226344.1 hypothetical protein [Methylobacterium sp. C25]
MQLSTPAKTARQMVRLTAALTSMERRNPVKALNDVRTEFLSQGVFGDYERAVIAECDLRIAELIQAPCDLAP